MGCSVKTKIVSLCCSGWILAIVGAVMIPIVNYIVKHKVYDSVTLVEGRLMYSMWKELPIPIYMQFYMFNVTNSEEVLKGGIPNVAQIGPYTYQEKRIKYDIIHNDNDTVTYKQNRTFHFLPEMSAGHLESDLYITPNPVYWSLISALKWIGTDIRTVINFVTKFEKETVFMKKTMKEIIWGYQDDMLHLAQTLDSEWFYTDTIGYFMHKNDTYDGVYTVFTGQKNISILGMIDKFNGTNLLPFWTSKYANMINGSDGTISPPFRKKTDSTPMFASDICRSIQGEYSGDVFTSQGIRLWRHTAPLNYMANATENPDNIGFCTPKSKCLDTGMLNISTCQLVDNFHIPIGLSFPNFYLAADKYTKSVTGLQAIAEQHQTAVDVEPYTGLVLQVAKRLQVNLYIQPIEEISPTANLRKTFVPVFWLNESAVIDDKNADLLKSMLFTPLKIVEVLEIGLISIGCLTLSITLIYAFCNLQRGKLNLKRTGTLQNSKLGNCCLYSPLDNDRDALVST